MRLPLRRPAEETLDLYPGLVVCDDRVTGSITVGESRLPLWAFVGYAVNATWDDVEASYSTTEHYGYTAEDLSAFLGDLMEQRGEFGRLLLILADAQRFERRDKRYRSWWQTKKHRKRVADQLRRCLAVLEEE